MSKIWIMLPILWLRRSVPMLKSTESLAIHEGLAFLIEHMPSLMRIIMTTRTDPPLPPARMRVRSQLLELRSADLL